MKERANKINELKYKLKQKKILEVFFEGCSAEDIMFIQENECKEKVRGIFNIAYQNIVKEVMVIDANRDLLYRDNISSEYKELFNAHLVEIKRNKMNVFFWGSDVYCAEITGEVLARCVDKIMLETGNNDLVITSTCLNFGLCLLCDEHNLSIAYWNNNV